MPTADLSVVVANYNHAAKLPRALDAILSQSVRPREVPSLSTTPPTATTAGR